jgi:chromosomal replication initiator protein
MSLRYVPCETFVNELLYAIRTDDRGDRRRRFRERYRNVDALLIDDVEFLSRTEASQEELFHTFNALYESGRQIVLTSDQPPSEIPRLAARLRSRFEAGLVADIQAPDVDLRRALLEAQARASGADVPDTVVDFLADRVRRNVRELEGALTRTLIYTELRDLALSPETAALALDGLGRSTSDRPPKPREILTAVGTHFEVSPDDLVGKRRDARTAGARQVAMYLLRNDGRETFPEIGRLLGGRDHSTILHGCGKIARRLKIENRLKTDLTAIRAFVAAHP